MSATENRHREGFASALADRMPAQIRKILLVMDAPYPELGWCCERELRAMGYQTLLVDQKRNHLPLPADTVWQYGVIARRLRMDRVNDRLVNAVVRRAATEFEPDLILLSKCENLSVRTIRHLRERAILINWNLDNPFHPLNTSISLLRSLSLLSCYGSFARSFMPVVETLGCRRVEYWPCYYYPDLHDQTVELSEQDRARFGCDAVFAGGWSPEREEMLSAVADLDLAIWGPGWERVPSSSPLRRSVRGPRVVGPDYVKAMKGARCVLNVLSMQGRGANNLRSFEATGLGCFLLTERSDEHARVLFTEGEEIACFTGPEELGEKLRYYLSRPEERAAVARRGQARTMGMHTLRHRLVEVMKVAEELIAARADGPGTAGIN